MANILQVTTPSVNADNSRIQHSADALGTVRLDEQEGGRTQTATGEGAYNVIDYESNYGAFVGKLLEGEKLSHQLDLVLFGGGLWSEDQEGVGNLKERLLESITVTSREELLTYLRGQEAVCTKFSGAFFDGLRAALAKNPSDAFVDMAMQFLRSCSDYMSGSHYLKQMRILTDDIGHLMFKAYGSEFQQLVDLINWDAAGGDTLANQSILNSRLIPFLSNYIGKTHDYGAVRDAVMLLILNAVRYENGSGDQLQQLFDRLVGDREFERFYQGDALGDFNDILDGGKQQTPSKELADHLSAFFLKGAGGQAGPEHIQQFYDVLNGMLLNESVYMPLLHSLIPFQYQDQEVMSELWVDPDAQTDQEDGARKIKLFLTFDIRDTGAFDLILTLQNRQVDMQLYVPLMLAHNTKQIQEHMAGIFKDNGLECHSLLVRERKEPIGVETVFPEIMERGNAVNVRV